MKTLILMTALIFSPLSYANECEGLLSDPQTIAGADAEEVFNYYESSGYVADLPVGGSDGYVEVIEVGSIELIHSDSTRGDTYKIDLTRANSRDLWDMQSELKPKVSAANKILSIQYDLGFVIKGQDAKAIYNALVMYGVPEDVGSGGSGGASYYLDTDSFYASRVSSTGKPDAYKIDLTNAKPDAFAFIKHVLESENVSNQNIFFTKSLMWALPMAERTEAQKEEERPKSIWERIFN